MSTDIIAINSGLPINNKTAVCSVLPNGSLSSYIIRKNYPVALTIGNIESKFIGKWDDVSYYFGNGVQGSGIRP